MKPYDIQKKNILTIDYSISAPKNKTIRKTQLFIEGFLAAIWEFLSYRILPFLSLRSTIEPRE